MRLLHYTHEEFELKPREYDQSKMYLHSHPNGLWFNVDGKEEEDLRVSFKNSKFYHRRTIRPFYEITLNKNSNILYLNTKEDIFELIKKYPYHRYIHADSFGRKILYSYEVDWFKIKKEYQGVIIPNYHWECVLSKDSIWYYGWDCKSGCIWDLNCIEQFRFFHDHV